MVNVLQYEDRKEEDEADRTFRFHPIGMLNQAEKLIQWQQTAKP